jgi:two-component system, sporulation sensor kinase E
MQTIPQKLYRWSYLLLKSKVMMKMDIYTTRCERIDIHQDQILDVIMSDMNLGVIILDRDQRIQEISEMACTTFGQCREHLINASIHQLMNEQSVPNQLIRQAMFEGVAFRNYPISFQRISERFELLMDTNVIRDETDRIIGLCITFKDVTNLRSLEEQIIRSDRLATIGQIAAGAAHEIRNPLTSIRGFLQLFERRFAADPDSREQQYIRIMMKEIDRINQLVNEFLLLSKPRAPKWTHIDLNQTIREILPVIESDAILKNILLEYIPDADLPIVIADSEMMKQVLLNICKNAMEAMPNGGSLTIDMHQQELERMIVIRITDTGHGIAPYLLDKIFEPFYSTKPDGTGLGLSICQRIVHDIGGQIRVSSKGYGTTFYIKIPYLNITH